MFKRTRICHWTCWLESYSSLKYKLANYIRKLKRLGCPEVEINSFNKEKTSPASGVKKRRKAEVNYCPSYPSGESAETLEKIRETLVLEAKKKNNEDTVAAMMTKTFAHRRQEIIRDAPMIAVFKTRWPALCNMREVNMSMFFKIQKLFRNIFCRYFCFAIIVIAVVSRFGGKL